MDQTLPLNRVSLLLLIFISCFAFSSASPASESESVDFSKAKNVLLGEAIEAAAFNRDFRSAALLQLALDQQQLSERDELPLLYLAKKYVELGLAGRAMDVYRLIAEQGEGERSERAWLAYAKLAIDNARFDLAEQALPHTGKRLDNEQRVELGVIQSLVYLHQRKEKAAIRALPKFKHDTDWSLYQRYNIAVTLLSHYRNKRGALILGELAKLDVQNDPAKAALRDQANLALGYSLLQLNKARQARKYLAKINLDTLMASQALLGMGWAYSAENNYRKALVYWLELQKNSITNTQLYESALAVPYGFGRAGAVNRAAEAYDDAIHRFEADIVAMNAAKEEIARGMLVTLLRAGDPADEFSWLDAWRSAPTRIGVGKFVPLLMESPVFQQALQEYRYILKLRERYKSMDEGVAQLEALPHAAQLQSDISAAHARYLAIGEAFRSAIDTGEEHLNALATEILESHQQQLKNYGQQARFGLAQAIEQAAFGRRESD